MFQLRVALFIAAAGTIGLYGTPVSATSGTVSVSQTHVGITPLHVGYNMGHYLPGSNTSAWVDYSGVNGFRVWASPGDYEPSGDWGSGVDTLAQFAARKAAVSANPEGNGYIPWASYHQNFENRIQSGRNKVNLNYILGELHEREIAPIMQITRSPKTINGDGNVAWADRWEQWQHFYAMAYHAAKNYDVERYQMYNEPDQSSTSAQRTPQDWLVGLKLASDAVRTAIADVNRLHGKTLQPYVAGPTRIGGTGSTSTWSPGPGFVDYGEAALESNRTNYAGLPVAHDVMNVYDLHRYNDSSAGGAYVSDILDLKRLIPQYNVSGQMLPVTYTEYNRRSSSAYASSSDTPDTPLMFSDFASINLKAMSQGVHAMYAFKFSQTMWDPPGGDSTLEPQKTGFFYVADDYSSGGTNDIGGASKGAGVQRLFAKAFKGARPRLQSSGTSLSTYDLASSFDAASGNYYLMGVNRHTTEGHNLTIDLNGWDVQPGTVISVEEVSGGHHGEVTRLVTVPQSKIITLDSQPSQSVWLLTAPSGTPQGQLLLRPSDDARVRNSDADSGVPYSTQNYGDLARARVGRTADSARFDYATYLQFDTGTVDAADVSRAILQLTGQSNNDAGGNPGSILFHVYALADDGWDESTITWDNAPYLGDAPAGSLSSDTRLGDVGIGAMPVGHLTFDHTISEWGVDLTDFLRHHPDWFDDGTLSFALVREERFAGDVDPTFSYVDLWTKESGLATSPKLHLSVIPEPGSMCLIAGIGAALLLRRPRWL
ncbi:MAG TPA: DNRLRE domain-containing protein [Tepidisphaeraceae bacterium]|nr:DNRLRE domain-containing protein [Tepidisphaeraceae bacterium]